MKLHTPSTAETSVRPEQVAPGDYFHSEEDLFRVEECDGNRVLLEDCRTEILIDVSLAQLAGLVRVRR